jgi:hypothetical protein
MRVTQNTKTSEFAILARLLSAHMDAMTPRLARYILTLGFSEAEQARMNDLARRNQAGSLASEEQQELMNYAKAGRLLALLHSQARKALKRWQRP